MAEFNEENKFEDVFKEVKFEKSAPEQDNGVNLGNFNGNENNTNTVFSKVEGKDLPIKPSIWSKVKSFLFQEINFFEPVNITLTPYQQKVEDEINEFLHQEVSFKGFFNLFKSKK